MVRECETPTPLEFRGKHAEIGFDFSQRLWAASLVVTVGDVDTFGGGRCEQRACSGDTPADRKRIRHCIRTP